MNFIEETVLNRPSRSFQSIEYVTALIASSTTIDAVLNLFSGSPERALNSAAIGGVIALLSLIAYKESYRRTPEETTHPQESAEETEG